MTAPTTSRWLMMYRAKLTSGRFATLEEHEALLVQYSHPDFVAPARL